MKYIRRTPGNSLTDKMENKQPRKRQGVKPAQDNIKKTTTDKTVRLHTETERAT